MVVLILTPSTRHIQKQATWRAEFKSFVREGLERITWYVKLMIKRRGDRKKNLRVRSRKHMNKEFNLGRCKQKIPFVKKIGIPSKRLRVLRYEFNENLINAQIPL